MAEEYYKVIKERGTHLAQDKTGKNLGALFDDNNHLAGQARFVKVDPSEIGSGGPDLEGIAAVGRLAFDIGIAIYQIYQECKDDGIISPKEHREEGTETIRLNEARKGLFSQREINKILSKPKNPFGQKRYQPTKKASEVKEIQEEQHVEQKSQQVSAQPQMEEVGVLSAQEFSTIVDNTIEGYIYNSNDPEIQKRLVRITFLSMMMAQEIRGLIQDCQKNNKAVNVDYRGWEHVMEKMLSERICNGINTILEKNPELFEENINLIPQNSSARLLLEDQQSLQVDTLAKILAVRPEYVPVGGLFCKYCGAKLYMQGALFCSSCGAQQH